MGESSYPYALSPSEARRVYREPNVGKSSQQSLECDRRFGPGKLESETEVHARAEREMRVGVTRDVESMRVLEGRGVTVGSSQKSCDAVAAPELMAREHDISRHPARLGKLNGRDLSETFLDA
jgi:hypothetical protein